MGCYGLGPSRVMGSIVEIYHDDKGLIWPESVAPLKVHLLSLKQNDKADIIYEELRKNDLEVLYDERDVSAGEKFADADLIGLPYRLVMSGKTGDKIEVKRRDEAKTQLANLAELVKILS